MAALCLVLMISTPAVAVNSFDPYPMGWIDVFSGSTHPGLMAADTGVPGSQASNITIAYYWATTEATRIDYLDAAFAAGVGVILEIERDLIYPTVDAAATCTRLAPHTTLW